MYPWQTHKIAIASSRVTTHPGKLRNVRDKVLPLEQLKEEKPVVSPVLTRSVILTDIKNKGAKTHGQTVGQLLIFL